MCRSMSAILFGTLLFCTLSPADRACGDAEQAVLPLPLPDVWSPWYPQPQQQGLITPRWVREDGVDAVIVLAIDDMRDSARYEQFLRPILNRLKQIDGRAPVSIMACDVQPDDAQLQSWLAEGLSIECHTIDHPCPLLHAADFSRAKSTYDRCVDLMGRIPGNQPVAFRTPCCDSLNTVSPRFFSEIFSSSTPGEQFLQIDSSVFMFYTSEDRSIPRELVLDPDGRERFLKYVPVGNRYREVVHDHFVNFIRDYPYPYVIGGDCWEIPCIAPSDWSAQHLHGSGNQQTLDDWKAAVDITVLKQGCFSLVFHPHGWIQADQVVDMIEHAVNTHGNRVKFLTFREVAERLNASLTDGRPLRSAAPETVAELIHRPARIRQLPTSQIPAAVLQHADESSRQAVYSLPEDQSGTKLLLVTDTTGTAVWIQAVEAAEWAGPLPTGPAKLPPLFRDDGSHNGFFAHDGFLCWQNEDTDRLPDLLVRISIEQLHDQARSLLTRRNRPPIPVGAAVVDITPDYPVRLSGYGNRTRESEGIAARIHARALAIGGHVQQTPLTVLLSVDNCGVPREITEAVFTQVASRHDLRRANFAVASTHTHSGPWLTEFAPFMFAEIPADHESRLQQYRSELIDRLVQVTESAIAARRPGRLSLGRGMATFAMNRRSLVDGRWSGFGESADGPVDHQLPVLAAHDTSGQLIAVLAGYACHATSETGTFNQISGDWPGVAASEIESQIPGAVALIAIGTGGDANPSPRGLHEHALQHGRTVADEVLRILKGDSAVGTTLDPIDPAVVCQFAAISLPLTPLPSANEWRQRADQGGVQGAHARHFLNLLESGQQVPDVIPDYPVQTWCFGTDLAMVFLGGEVVVDYSIRLNAMLDGSRLWINAYSNDVPCYIASHRLLREGGYEVDSSMLYYGRPARLAPEAEDLICDTVQRLLPHDFYSPQLATDFPGPKSPQQSLACMTTRPDLRVELVAAEPLIRDPVAFDWDVNGRLWVVEMGDYPNGPDPHADTPQAGSGRVRVLEDTNGDGRYDKATTFLEDLVFPTGICCWRGGIIVTAAPEIFYAEDSTGDGRADAKRTLFSGFAEGNQQHRVNGLRWGLNGWLYVANGDSGGQIQAVVDGQFQSPSLNLRGRDLRIQPDEGLMVALSGQTQFGRERDDFGVWFGNNNSNPIWQYVLEDETLRRNPHFAAPAVRSEVALIPGAAPVFPTSRTLARFNDFGAANRFTSACSTMIYRDTLLGDDFYGNAFTSEPVHNLVSRLILKREGVLFRGQRAADESQSEVLSSSDHWFRPTMLRTGPDGALYVADMYRQVIEHPEWIPPEYQRKLNLRAGSDRGRIYRLLPTAACCEPTAADAHPLPRVVDQPAAAGDRQSATTEQRTWLAESWNQVSTSQLLERLTSPNGWWRDTAQRLLLHRNERSVASELQRISRTHASPAVRVQALCTLQLLTAVDPDQETVAALVHALQDPEADVRRHAVLLLEPHLQSSQTKLPDAFFDLPQNPDPSVVFQLAISLGESAHPESGTLLGRILRMHGDNPWITAAAFSSLSADRMVPLLTEWTDPAAEDLPGRNAVGSSPDRMMLFGRLIGQAAAFQQLSAVQQPLHTMLNALQTADAENDPSVWLAAAESLRQIRRHPAVDAAIRQSSDIMSAEKTAVQRALETANNVEVDSSVRAACIQFAMASDSVSSTQILHLLQLVSPQTPIDIQQAVIAAIGTASDEKQTAGLLLNRWNSLGPAVRTSVLDLLLQKSAWTEELLNALAAGALSPVDLDAVRRERMLNHRQDSIRLRASQLLAAAETTSRQQIVDEWQTLLAGLMGDATAGRLVFEKRCAACHRLQGIGRSIGADLDSLRDRSLEAMLTAILDPNRAVESRFLSYTAVTHDGLTFSGMLLSETGSSLTLVAADGKEHVILRSDLEELVASTRSLMPEGLEKDLLPQDLADVIQFVRDSGTPWKRFDGNMPQPVQADAEDIITLPAAAAEIYGPRLEFESQYGNLGWWQSTDDYAIWTFEAKRSGHYTVEFEYACDDATAGNLVRISTGNRLLTARIPGTGTWDTYQRWTVGTLDVHGGRGKLIVTAAETPTMYLMDLKAIRLIPPQ